MDCEHVFAVLTRGPFPSGCADDAAVSRHLAGCESCRELAEALRPAADVFHESLPPSAAVGLPCYRSRQTAMARVSQAAASPRQDERLPAYQDEDAYRVAGRIQDRFGYARRRHPARYPQRSRVLPPSIGSDLLRVATFLSLLTAAACGLSWFFR